VYFDLHRNELEQACATEELLESTAYWPYFPRENEALLRSSRRNLLQLLRVTWSDFRSSLVRSEKGERCRKKIKETNGVKVVAFLLFLNSFVFTSPSLAADRIRIGYSGLSPATAMLWVTQEGKLFERNGLNPEILFLRNNLGQSAMIAGEIDMCSYSASLLAPARVQGADPVMIVSFQQKLNYRLVVRPEIRTLAELKGKVLGVTRYGTVNDATMRLLLN